MTQGRAILVVDDDPVSIREVSATLLEAGFHVETAASGAQGIRQLKAAANIDLLLLDLNMPEPNGLQVLRYVRSSPELKDLAVVMLTGTQDEAAAQKAFETGADDYIRKPCLAAELVARIKSQLALRDSVQRIQNRERTQATVLELTQALASTLEIHDILYVVAKRIAEVARVDRCSIVLTNAEAPDIGLVLASSDDDRVRDLPIQLNKYPEIQSVLSTAAPLIIEDATNHPLLDAVRHNETGVNFASVVLMPILQDREPTGVLFLRSRSPAAFNQDELALFNTIANATAIALRNARLWRSLRDETIKSTTARVEAEQRLQLFQRYADLFESAADGMIVVDRDGQVVFANPRAREILCSEESKLLNCNFMDLVAAPDRERAKRLIEGFSEGIYPRGVDLSLDAGNRDPIIASLSFSPVFHEGNAILFSFRDVTQDRSTASELRSTKEFLERVIDSSVDAIVVCDMDGTVLLFNRAAARIFRYPPAEVIGKMRVDSLYPPGVARDVMRRIRNPEVGGYGRLEDFRVDMLSARGETVPVILSAALVMENGVPVGSVGVFTDIRDRLRMEARLMTAQEELRTREKQVIVAELAGAAAHELNQPLTSVIGYAELLRRNLEAHPELRSAAEVIIAEAERMAEIVRKVGKITRYETKSYVGGARILDLERATDTDLPREDSNE